jgi:hypothetical protein
MQDDGTADAALSVIATKQFVFDYFCNGSLRIFDAENETLLSRKGAFIPVNMMVNPKGHEAEITQWKGEADRRATAEANKPQNNSPLDVAE